MCVLLRVVQVLKCFYRNDSFESPPPDAGGVGYCEQIFYGRREFVESNVAKMKALLLVVLALSAGSSSAEDYSGRLSCCGVLHLQSSNASDGHRQSDETYVDRTRR